ncbi:MAG: molybdate ABC transporter substrate-binding protein [Pseudomonadota bacterium]
MKTANWIKGLAAALWALSSGAAGAEAPLRVFAAASLQGPLDVVAAQWGAEVSISYAGSGTIARQIDLGAPADAVILASDVWAGWLAGRGHGVAPPAPLFSNRLVVIGPAGASAFDTFTATEVLARLDGGRLAMGQHQAVPAGQYAHAWLTHIGAWDALRPHLAETENVRAALAFVARGESPLGIVYASDAVASGAVSVLWTVPTDQHPTIRYPGLAFTPEGGAFLEHLQSQVPTFVAAGFAALP